LEKNNYYICNSIRCGVWFILLLWGYLEFKKSDSSGFLTTVESIINPSNMNTMGVNVKPNVSPAKAPRLSPLPDTKPNVDPELTPKANLFVEGGSKPNISVQTPEKGTIPYGESTFFRQIHP
jgi:hypothetical protein